MSRPVSPSSSPGVWPVSTNPEYDNLTNIGPGTGSWGAGVGGPPKARMGMGSIKLSPSSPPASPGGRRGVKSFPRDPNVMERQPSTLIMPNALLRQATMAMTNNVNNIEAGSEDNAVEDFMRMRIISQVGADGGDLVRPRISSNAMMSRQGSAMLPIETTGNSRHASFSARTSPELRPADVASSQPPPSPGQPAPRARFEPIRHRLESVHGADVHVTHSRRWRIWDPPRLFKNWDEVEDLSRKVSWLELFLDLVMVASVLQIGTFMKTNSDAGGLAMSFVVFCCLWYNWHSITMYITRFDTEDLVHNLFICLHGLAMTGMAVHVGAILTKFDASGFAISFVLSRMTHLAMYVLVYLFEETRRARHTAMAFMVGAVLSTFMFLMSLTAMHSLAVVGTMWMLGVVLDYCPYLYLMMWHKKNAPEPVRKNFLLPVDIEHVSERYGQLVMIVLGEDIISLAKINLHSWEFYSGITLGFIVCFCLQMLHFEVQPLMKEHNALRRSRNRGLIFQFVHPICAFALICFGVGLQQCLAHIDEPIHGATPFLICESQVFALLSFAIMRHLHKGGGGHSGEFQGKRLGPLARERVRIRDELNKIKQLLWVPRTVVFLILAVAPAVPKLQNNALGLITLSFFSQLIMVLVEGYSRSNTLLRQVTRTVHRKQTFCAYVPMHFSDAVYGEVSRFVLGHHEDHGDRDMRNQLQFIVDETPHQRHSEDSKKEAKRPRSLELKRSSLERGQRLRRASIDIPNNASALCLVGHQQSNEDRIEHVHERSHDEIEAPEDMEAAMDRLKKLFDQPVAGLRLKPNNFTGNKPVSKTTPWGSPDTRHHETQKTKEQKKGTRARERHDELKQQEASKATPAVEDQDSAIERFTTEHALTSVSHRKHHSNVHNESSDAGSDDQWSDS